jgi:2-polyprenyl-3-methyl-5-hydroxy-6-metoxy-1,4-benzoquinol methylase
MPPIDYYSPSLAGTHKTRAKELLDREQVALVRILKAYKEGMRVVDLGCGSGVFMQYLTQAGVRSVDLVGYEYSEELARIGKTRGLQIEVADFEQGVPVRESSVDMVYAAEILEHLRDPDFFIEEIARILKPGGHLVLTTPNLHAWYNRILFPLGIMPIFLEASARSTHIGAGPLRRFKESSIPVGHLHVFNYAALGDLLTATKFEALDICGTTFEYVPKFAKWIDTALKRIPRLASGFVVHARYQLEKAP